MPSSITALFVLLLQQAVFALFVRAQGCPERDFVPCVLRLRAQRVPFDKNILNVVFNVTSEAKMIHTCRAYSDVMPCFRDRIVLCGDDKQRRMLNEVGKMLMFLCSPFSMERQRQLLAHNQCIGKILMMPASTGCDSTTHSLGTRLQKCRDSCGAQGDFICLMKTWVSEQSVCTAIDIESSCGDKAIKFYTELQTTVFDPKFPLICEQETSAGSQEVDEEEEEVDVIAGRPRPSTVSISASSTAATAFTPPSSQRIFTVTNAPIDPQIESNTVSQHFPEAIEKFWRPFMAVKAVTQVLTASPLPPLSLTSPAVPRSLLPATEFPRMTAETFWPELPAHIASIYTDRFDPWTRRQQPQTTTTPFYTTTATSTTIPTTVRPNPLFPVPAAFPQSSVYIGSEITDYQGPIGVRETYGSIMPVPIERAITDSESPVSITTVASSTTASTTTTAAATTSTTAPTTTPTTTTIMPPPPPTANPYTYRPMPLTLRPLATTTWRPWYLGGREASSTKAYSFFKPEWPFRSPR